MSNKIKDTVTLPKKVQGIPRITVRRRDGSIVRQFTDENLVVSIGRNSLARLLAGDYSGYISHIELGTGGTAGNVWTPEAPDLADVSVNIPLVPPVSKAIAGFNYVNGSPATGVEFTIIFESHEVDDIVSEAVLKFNDGIIYARYTFPSVYLRVDKGYSMEIVWECAFN